MARGPIAAMGGAGNAFRRMGQIIEVIVQVCGTETVQVGGARGNNNKDGANGVCLCPCSLYKESIVDVEGTVAAAPEKIASCSQEDVEIVISKVASRLLMCGCLEMLLLWEPVKVWHISKTRSLLQVIKNDCWLCQVSFLGLRVPTYSGTCL